jgi:hypothetical protein
MKNAFFCLLSNGNKGLNGGFQGEKPFTGDSLVLFIRL